VSGCPLPADVNEALVRGREDVFFGAEFDASAGSKKLPDDIVAYYIDALASDIPVRLPPHESRIGANRTARPRTSLET
jgi:hypothetical protein